MKKYLGLIDEVYLKQQPDGSSLAYVSENYWDEMGINETAFEILKRLDGGHTFETLTDELSQHFKEEKTKAAIIISEFIESLEERALLRSYDEHQETPVDIRGSKEYFVPDSMILELTHNCPLRCKHCYANAGIGSSMDIDKLMPLLEQLTSLGTNYFQLTGGEPFAYPYIEDVIDFLLAKKIKFSITTSGFYWNRRMERIMNKLIGKKVSIQVSLDGLAENHNKIRCDERAYDKAIRFIKESVARKISTSVATCLVQQDMEEIEELCGLVKDLGVYQYRLGIITDMGRAEDNHISSQITSKEYQYIMDHLKEKHQTRDFYIGRIEEFEDVACQTAKNCGAGYRLYNLTPKLTFSPCTIFKLNIGNLNTENLESIFARNTRLFSGMTPPSESICGSCELLESCKSCFAEGFSSRHKVERCHWHEDEYKNICVKA